MAVARRWAKAGTTAVVCSSARNCILRGRREQPIALAAEQDGVGNSGSAIVRGGGFERCGESAPLHLHQKTALRSIEMSVVAFLHANAEVGHLNSMEILVHESDVPHVGVLG